MVIEPLAHNSHDITLSDWMSLLTLCLAPLIAHVLVGAPSPTYLTLGRPVWHERICHYNPTSILWRYAIIADRRIRARNWDRIDLAATNALFWTEKGWNGSEEIIKYSRSQCIQLPDNDRVSLLSRDTTKSLIVTIQGLQALVLLLGCQLNWNGPKFTPWMAVDMIFFPIALFGLLRLCSCLWLTDEFSFASLEDVHISPPPRSNSYSTASFELLAIDPLTPEPQRFQRPSYWASRLFRLTYLSLLLALLVLSISFLIPFNHIYFKDTSFTMTSFLVDLFYISFLTATAVIYTWYLSLKQATSTVIPCISSPWYKIYTAVVIGFGITIIIIASIETRTTWCGKFTSAPPSYGDTDFCG
ncbi:hypothetical protein DER46DRAFT_672220 [Fusarium sp. MPI-SDFR-AT-0072]|nr:hypothetical protein DER46DRAFT_672220 [Fusarium sp. MPI-SDFR-AT-0072]